jgi:hippurate hydrolase
MLRADMDALPMKENSGLSYASTKSGKDASGEETAIAHSCAHDMHVTWLMGTTRILAENRDSEDFSNFARTWNVPSVFWFVGAKPR